MKKYLVLPVAVLALGLGLGGCNSPGDRAVGGALIGGATGAAIGGITGGGRGALVGGAIGAAGGAVIGAATTPNQCPYGSYRAYDGNVYCR